MLSRLLAFVTGENDDGFDAAAYFALMVLGFFFGLAVARLAENNLLFADVRSYLREQRRISVAAAQRDAQRDIAGKERPDA